MFYKSGVRTQRCPFVSFISRHEDCNLFVLELGGPFDFVLTYDLLCVKFPVIFADDFDLTWERDFNIVIFCCKLHPTEMLPTCEQGR